MCEEREGQWSNYSLDVQGGMGDWDESLTPRDHQRHFSVAGRSRSPVQRQGLALRVTPPWRQATPAGGPGMDLSR